ncbi:MAG: hypothetical protein CMJ68_00050 [Planctomycetaceae bacterium]|nr:hypothetical protein [Planctomycetaceae bacterium]
MSSNNALDQLAGVSRPPAITRNSDAISNSWNTSKAIRPKAGTRFRAGPCQSWPSRMPVMTWPGFTRLASRAVQIAVGPRGGGGARASTNVPTGTTWMSSSRS